MDRRLVPIAATVLLALGAITTLRAWLAPAAPPPLRVTAVVARAVEPYTLLTLDALVAGPSLEPRDALGRGAYAIVDAVGLMTVDRLAPGDLVTTANARPPRDVRFTDDFALEIVSFGATAERLVGGELHPGHVVNVYGTGRDRAGQPVTVLVEPRVWVVDVTAGGGRLPERAREVDLATGAVTSGGADRARAASVVTVAVAPPIAARMVEAIGARGFTPWLTLAANEHAELPDPFASPSTVPTTLPPGGAAVWMRPTAVPTIADTGGGGARARP